MGNFIKVPLAINPPRSFVTGAVDGPFTWEDAVGTISAGAASAALASDDISYTLLLFNQQN